MAIEQPLQFEQCPAWAQIGPMPSQRRPGAPGACWTSRIGVTLGSGNAILLPGDNCHPPFGFAVPMPAYDLTAPYSPKGDQPTAINQLVAGVNNGERYQTLLGATGTGKTFTMANVIAQTGRPALVLAHNKTLAAQLCNELREFFPENAVEYFISYYDYYQPEAYVPVSDTYIAKTASINEEIDMLRHSATRSLFERREEIVVASIICIY